MSTAGGELELALGDLIITVKDEAGATVPQGPGGIDPGCVVAHGPQGRDLALHLVLTPGRQDPAPDVRGHDPPRPRR